MSRRYADHKYTWSKPFGSVRHNWSLVGPVGAINFHVSLHEKYDPSAGLEIHRYAPADYQRHDAPSHLDCDLTGGRCWHDGTSLYASESLWPLIEPYLRDGSHETIFGVLEREADERFGLSREDEAEAAS